MSTSSVDGLVSGLNTSSMITQLMQVEAAPQTRLKDKVTTAQNVVASYQSVNSKIAAFKTAADNLSQLSTWRGIQAASSSSSVTATAVTGTNGSAGATSFDVVSLARSQISTTRVPTTGDATNASTIDITVGPLDGSADDKVTTISLTDRSAQGIADAINSAGLGVKAAVVSTGGAQNVLQFSGTKTGAANGFRIDGLTDTVGNPQTLNTVANATNAELEIGGGEDNGGYSATSDTNTFSKLMPGVSVTVSKLETGVNINATQDVSGISSKIQAMVDAANATLTEISGQTAYDAGTKTGSPLTGDFAVRNMSQKILSGISEGLTDKIDGTNPYGSLSQLGVQLDATGKLTFDATKFATAYAADPSTVQKAGTALGDKFEAMSTTMTTNLTSVITGRNSEIDGLNDQIDNWDIRLAAKKEALQRQYSDLEVALGKLKDQSTWLSGQLAGLS